MIRSVLTTVLIWAALGWGLYSAFHGVFTPPGDLIGALLGSFLAMLGIGALRNIPALLRERKCIARGIGPTVSADGSQCCASGTLQPLGGTFSSPFTGTECVACAYEIFRLSAHHNSSADTNRQPLLSGVRMNSCGVKTSDGVVRLLGWPVLKDFERNDVTSAETIDAARRFIASEKFEDLTGIQLGKKIDAVRALLADDDGIVEARWRMKDDFDLEAVHFEEECVVPGEPVCAVGCYSAAKGGLGYAPDGKVILRLYRGTPEEVSAAIFGRMLGYAFLAALLLSLGIGGSWLGLTLREGSSELRAVRRDTLHEALATGEPTRIRAALEGGADVNAADPFGVTPLMKAASAEIVRMLLAKRAELETQDGEGKTALAIHASRNDRESVALLVRAGARLDVADHHGRTPLALARLHRSDSIGAADAESLLRDAGAPDIVVTAADAQPASDAARSVCLRYLTAVVDGDKKTLSEILPDRPLHTFEGVDVTLWGHDLPRNPTAVVGFERGDRATVHVTGETPASAAVTWECTLFRKDGVWRMIEERLLDAGMNAGSDAGRGESTP